MAGEFAWNITEDHRLIKHVHIFADLDINFSVHLSFHRTGKRVLPSSSIESCCKGNLRLSGKNYCVTRTKLGVDISL